MDQAQRDLAYENGAFIPDAEQYGPRWQADAAAFRARTPCELDIPYDQHDRAAYDLFFPQGEAYGLMVFVHGGYWRMRAKSDWSHYASAGLARGWAVAMIGYPLAPDIRLSQITRHVAIGIAAAAARVRGPISLAGHSAGGHLVARMSMPGVLSDAVAARILRTVVISGVSDLRPLLDLTMNAELGLDAAEAAAESPVLGPKHAHIHVTTFVGAEERPVFLDQSRWLAEAWGIKEIILPGRHHFDILDGLEDPNSLVMREVLG
ncbi:MAG: alpha/beta hydrolase [Pseudomonadota bacterium]